MTYARHARHADSRKARHSHKLLAFVAAQNARLTAAATNTLTLGANPSDTQTIVIGAKTYTFQTSLTEADGHVKIGADATASATNLFHAINKSGGTAGTDYANAMVANANFVATNPSTGAVTITAKVKGPRTDATTSTVTSGTWAHTTVQGGVTFDTLASLKKNTAAQIAGAASAAALK